MTQRNPKIQEITEIKSLHSLSIEQISNKAVLIVDPLNNTDPKHMGTRQEIRIYDLPSLQLSQVGEGAFATRNISNALEETVSGFAYVFSDQALWSVNLSTLAMQFMTQGIANEAKRVIGVYDPHHDVIYIAAQDMFNSDIIRISRTSGDITGAVRLPTPITAHRLMMDSKNHKLVVMGSVDKRTSSASLFNIDSETFRVVQNGTLIGSETDYEGITADIDVENRRVFVSDAAGSLYSVNLDNFADQKRIQTRLGHTKQWKMVLARDVLYFLYPDGTLLSITESGESTTKKIEPVEKIHDFIYSSQLNSLLFTFFSQEKWFLGIFTLE